MADHGALETARLHLSPPTRADVAAVLAIAGDPRAVEHNPSDLVTSVAQAEELVDRWIRHWERFGFGYSCVRLTGQPDVVGYCGIKVVRFRDGEALNLIYRFAPAVWGTGLATEAATRVVAYAAEHQPERRLIARIRPGNLASQRVATKVGLRHDETLDLEGQDGLDLIFTAPVREPGR